MLVIGGSPSGVAAAIQSARSKVKTILATEGIGLRDSVTATETVAINIRHNPSSGIWGEFEEHLRDLDTNRVKGDSPALSMPAFKAIEAETILKKMTDSVKNLVLYQGAAFVGIEKNGDRWEAQFEQNGKTLRIKAKSVIDATEKGVVAKKAGAKLRGFYDSSAGVQDLTAFRTSIACGGSWPGGSKETVSKTGGYPPQPAWYIPLSAVIASEIVNVFVTESTLPPNKSAACLPLQLELGQGAGAAAAFCAFYNTTNKSLRVRSVQGELLDYKACLLPFADVNPSDPDWRAIQQVGVTGLLAGSIQDMNTSHAFNFMPDSLVRTAEIEPGLREIYTRAFIWFGKEKPGLYFTTGNMLSLISDYSLTDPAILRGSIQKAWKAQFKFTSEFEMSQPITRREFAVLANKYLNPFARTVDLGGRLVN